MPDMPGDRPVDVPDPAVIRHIHRVTEPYHTIVYFASERGEIYRRLGLGGASGYFASRSAALGAVPAQVVTATFFNFAPDLVTAAMDGVWAQTTPEAVLAARLEVVDVALRAQLGDAIVESDEMARAAALARGAAAEATSYVEGRPLFAAHAALDWPTEPHLVLWHAVTLLREFRGDGHVATLVTTGLDGLDAIVINAASRQIPESFLRATRGWDEDAWTRAIELHRQTGWLAPDDDGTGALELTSDGVEQREAIEAATDRASTLPWLAIGTAGITELDGLMSPWAKTLSDGMFAQFKS
ncbi:MAG TPA: hypothetical protein VFN21_06405 [Acidimicrobiales bacterium]|nr:hypothetical protein [Acidimicrobiales bacterium]